MIDTTFSVEHNAYGAIQVHDLKPDGRDLIVSEENKREYVRYGLTTLFFFFFPHSLKMTTSKHYGAYQFPAFLLLFPPFLLDYHDVGAADLTDKTTVPRSRPYLALFSFFSRFLLYRNLAGCGLDDFQVPSRFAADVIETFDYLGFQLMPAN